MAVSLPRPFRAVDQASVTRLFLRAWRRDQDPPLPRDYVCPFGLSIFVVAVWMMHTCVRLPVTMAIILALGAVITGFRANRHRSLERYLDASLRQGVGDLDCYCRKSNSGRPYRRCWVMEDGSHAVVGFVVLQCRRSDRGRAWLPPHGVATAAASRQPGLATIQWLAVDEHFQRQGVASALLRCAENYCRALEPSSDDGFSPCHHLRLVCSSAQRGPLDFYKRAHHYTEEHRTEYLWDSAWESGIFLWKRLR
mmetsp:Transcript_14900/g.38453  ORF Transcript_14900/g.38453 Transcript_14900/m.38453 type:complete len:252 (+) Transcript_14900:35-790(+)